MPLHSPTAADFLGGLVIEVCIGIFLYGIVTAQSCVYAFNCRDDARSLKSIVAIVWILESLHTALTVHMMYTYTIIDFGRLPEFGFIIWSIGLSILSELFIVGLVQGFFIRRIWILSSRNTVLTLIPSFLLFSRLMFGVTTVALIYILKVGETFRTNRSSLFTLSFGLGLSAVVDVLISCIMIYYLRKGQAGLKSTVNVVRLVMAYTINSGLITSIVSVAVVLTFVFFKHSLLFVGLVLVAGKLYSNSLLGALNARRYLRSKMEGENVDVTLSPPRFNTGVMGQSFETRYRRQLPVSEFPS